MPYCSSSSSENSKPKPRKINLLCPSLSKKVVVALDDENGRIDLGSIARAFGMEPSTLRLNGYFISRGIDLVSSSLTWNSLLSFFYSRRLSTGKHPLDALLVTGKLCKPGNKRGHDSQDIQKGNGTGMESENACRSRGTHLEAINMLQNKKLRESSSSGDILKGLCSKRKRLLEGVNLFKKLKISEDKPGMLLF